MMLLFEYQVSNYFMTVFSLCCIASVFLSIMHILTSSAIFTPWKVNHIYIIKTKGAPYLIPELHHVLFPGA
jgi:hypothetical protein